MHVCEVLQVVLILETSGHTLRDASPFHPTFSSLEIVTLQCAETTPEESPGPVRAEGGKASKSGWVGQGNGLEGSPEKVISDLNLEG